MLVFLDLDGVLRREGSPLYELEDELLARFEFAVRALGPRVRVVISSTWREAFSLAEIRGRFSADIAERIVGATPVSGDHRAQARGREVRAYLKKHGDEPWLALDDQAHHFPDGAPLVLTASERGFDDEALDAFLKAARLLLKT